MSRLLILAVEEDGHEVAVVVGDALHRQHAQVERVEFVAPEPAPRRKDVLHQLLVVLVRLRPSVCVCVVRDVDTHTPRTTAKEKATKTTTKTNLWAMKGWSWLKGSSKPSMSSTHSRYEYWN